MKKIGVGLIIVAIFAGLALFIALVVQLSSSYLKSTSSDSRQSCSGTHISHKVIIRNGTATPSHINGRLCDTLIVTNLDAADRLLAFGRHDDHVPYDGIGEKTLSKDQNLTITFIEQGNYLFHDHLHDEVRGTFTVSK